MNTIDINHHKVIAGRRSWIKTVITWVVAQLNMQAKFFE